MSTLLILLCIIFFSVVLLAFTYLGYRAGFNAYSELIKDWQAIKRNNKVFKNRVTVKGSSIYKACKNVHRTLYLSVLKSAVQLLFVLVLILTPIAVAWILHITLWPS